MEMHMQSSLTKQAMQQLGGFVEFAIIKFRYKVF